MKIYEYKDRLPHLMERRDVLSLLSQVLTDLQSSTTEDVRAVAQVLDYQPFHSKYGQSITTAFNRVVRFNGSPIVLIHESLQLLESHLSTAEREIKRKFGDEIVTSTLTYDRIALLRFVETAEFYVDYTRKLVHRLLVEENSAQGNSTPSPFSKGQIAWLDEGLKDYVRLYVLMSTPARDFQRLLTGISSAEVNEATHEVAMRSLGRSGTDPGKLFSSVGLEQYGTLRLRHPIYALGRAWAERQVTKHKERKESVEALKLRLQEWRELNESGKASPRLQKLIDHTEKRIEKLDYRIHKFEEENAYSEDDYL